MLMNPIAMHEAGKARRDELLQDAQRSRNSAFKRESSTRPVRRLALRQVVGGAVGLAVLISFFLI